MGLFFNTAEDELEILGVKEGELAALSNEQLLLLMAWRMYIAEFSESPLSDELYKRATGRERLHQ